MRRFLKRRLPVPTPMDSAEREYYRNLRKYTEKYIEFLRSELDKSIPKLKAVAGDQLPRVDGKDENIEKIIRTNFEIVHNKLMDLFPDSTLLKWAQAMAGRVNKQTKVNSIKTAKVKDIDIEPLMRDKELTPYFKNVVQENVGLIRSIPQTRMAEFKNKLVHAITEDHTKDTIMEMIQQHFGMTRHKARLIARDQVNKLNGKLDEYRQKQIGVGRYIWRTAKDERVAGNPRGKYPDAKPSHWAREGKPFSWNKPPEGGHPKERVQCRCWAEPILDDILDD